MAEVGSIKLSAGKTLFKEGEIGDTMYMIKEGKVELLVKGGAVEVVGPGGILGEMALIDQKPRSATAIAQTDCTLLPVKQDQFFSMIQQTPSFAIKVMRMMCDRLRRMDATK
jgi:CRP-like cAMP-binding protein